MDNPVLQYVAAKGSVTTKELLENLGLPERTLFRELERLVNDGQLVKIGNRPNVIYKLPSLAASSETPSAETSQTSTSTPEPTLHQGDAGQVYSEPLLYWCKFLRLDPKAVTESYHQIRPLVPNYQSVGMNPPKSKKLGLKMPDPIWVRFFNLLTWILAIVWTILKNCWSLFRKFYKGEILWGPIVMTLLAAWLIFGLIIPKFVKPKDNASEKMVPLHRTEQVLSTHEEELQSIREEYERKLSDAKSKIRTLQKELIQSESQTSSLKYDLEKEQARTTKLKEEMEGLRRSAESKKAEDRIVVTKASGLMVVGKTNVSGKDLDFIRQEAESLIGFMGQDQVWSDYGPDSEYVSVIITLNGKTHTINSWYPFYKDKDTIAYVDGSLVVVSSKQEKEKLESTNDQKHRALMKFLDKIIA